MGSYNYEALHRRTPSIKRTWSGDPLSNGYRAVPEPYMNGYGNVLQDRFHLAQAAQAQAAQAAQAQARVQALSNGPYYDLPQYTASAYDTRFAAPVGFVPSTHLPEIAERNVYAAANRLPVPWAMTEPISLREPILRREPPVMMEPLIREPLMLEPAIPEPGSLISSPSSSPPSTPGAPQEPPLPGMIFGCTSETYIECMQLKLFALPATNKSEVMKVSPGTKLFLYNYTQRELSGIFEATSHGDMNLMPEAFQGFFPAQVCVECVQKCPNLKMKALKEAISENFDKKGFKFKYALNSTQVGKLVRLFQQEAKRWQKQMKKLSKNMSFELQPSVRPNYSARDELNFRRQVQSEQASLMPTPKWARLF